MPTQDPAAIGTAPAPPEAWSSSAELRQMLRQLQEDALSLASFGLFAAGAVVGALAAQAGDLDRGLALSLAAFALAAVSWSLRAARFRLAAALLSVGAVALNLAAIAWAGLGWSAALLALPIGLTTLMLGAPAGAAAAAASTALLMLAPAGAAPASAELRAASLLAAWGAVGLVWLMLRPLLTAVRWAWAGYERNQSLMERMQEAQVRLQQTLEDLTSANTQLARLTQLADGLRQSAEEALQAKEQFVANVSHELRTPLNMIVGFGEMIVNAPVVYGSPLPPALLADLSVILRNSRHLSELIDDVLDLSQIEAGHMALTRERVDLRETCEAAAIAVRPLFESKGLSLSVTCEPSLPHVFCDRTRIREVVLNLLSNAGRFTERGGAAIRARRENGQVVVSVSDTGPGISSADQDRLFRPFEQLDGSIRRRYGGSGLGLTISKSFVELHGGRMWLESTPGAGTSIHFSLPIDPPMPIHTGAVRWLNPDWPDLARTRPPLAPPPMVKPRLVVVDANQHLQRLLARYLDGAEVAPAPDLPAALRALSESPAQALVINGLRIDDWLHRLSASPQLPYGTPAIVCAVPDPADLAGALEVSEYLLKPIDQDRLLAALERLMPHGRRDGAPRTVLVVDDEPDALRLFWRILSSAGRGYRVLTAGNGRQAIELLRQQRPDAVLLDLVMPDGDGFQFLALKNEDPATRSIPVAVISARDAARQPIVSNAIGFTRAGGISLPQLLACIEAISRALSPLAAAQPPDPAPPAAAPG